MPHVPDFVEDERMPKKIDAAVKERALRMFADHRRHYPADTARADGDGEEGWCAS